MYYVLILKNSIGKIEIGYTEINPEVNLNIAKEKKRIIYYEAYKDEKSCFSSSLSRLCRCLSEE